MRTSHLDHSSEIIANQIEQAVLRNWNLTQIDYNRHRIGSLDYFGRAKIKRADKRLWGLSVTQWVSVSDYRRQRHIPHDFADVAAQHSLDDFDPADEYWTFKVHVAFCHRAGHTHFRVLVQVSHYGFKQAAPVNWIAKIVRDDNRSGGKIAKPKRDNVVRKLEERQVDWPLLAPIPNFLLGQRVEVTQDYSELSGFGLCASRKTGI